MGEVNPDVLAQMKRIWSAVNDGTLNKEEVNDALRLLHDFLSGVAYESRGEAETEEGDAVPPTGSGPDDEEGDHPHKAKARRKR